MGMDGSREGVRGPSLLDFFSTFFSVCALVAPTSFMVTAVKTLSDYSAPQKVTAHIRAWYRAGS